jgi:hypothetical protein
MEEKERISRKALDGVVRWMEGDKSCELVGGFASLDGA